MVSFLQVSPPKPCAHLFLPSYVPHAPPISFFSSLSPAQYWVRRTGRYLSRHLKINWLLEIYLDSLCFRSKRLAVQKNSRFNNHCFTPPPTRTIMMSLLAASLSFLEAQELPVWFFYAMHPRPFSYLSGQTNQQSFRCVTFQFNRSLWSAVFFDWRL